MKQEHAEMAASHLGSAEMPEHKPMKEMHVKELHDGSYHAMMHHGDPMKPPEEGSGDMERMHDMMHEHFGGGKTEGEGSGPKKQGHEEKASVKPKKPTSSQNEKPGGAEEDEG